jgi:hypothetical protein
MLGFELVAETAPVPYPPVSYVYREVIFQALPHLEVLPKGPGYLDWVLLCFCEFL